MNYVINCKSYEQTWVLQAVLKFVCQYSNQMPQYLRIWVKKVQNAHIEPPAFGFSMGFKYCCNSALTSIFRFIFFFFIILFCRNDQRAASQYSKLAQIRSINYRQSTYELRTLVSRTRSLDSKWVQCALVIRDTASIYTIIILSHLILLLLLLFT